MQVPVASEEVCVMAVPSAIVPLVRLPAKTLQVPVVALISPALSRAASAVEMRL